MPVPSTSTTAPPPGTTAAPTTRPITETLPPYRVILHNDDVNDMRHVIHALLESVPELTPERAAEIMLAAHNNGQAEVIRCPLERAELYRDRLKTFGLTATIEAA